MAGQRPPLSCRTSPPQGGRSALLHFRPLKVLRLSTTMELPISPLEGEMSGRTEGAFRANVS
ncbi:MAG: hypothetical protein E5X43_19655 [Mesorhizobium sp.]|nr:MAG: hypothetical protein EOR48_08950 [Mesorhizobium sp.]TIP48180.1 MAG: hypothetical protein E5X62_03245 [Mesorhizobium sp.]TIR09345.1 MAG: hypothetical protein E5X64_25245 [Mesorhizobium sp.]TJW87305.1 MAG: hypothetical protein E5X43_19655 [Mesorhizobium sp.]